MTDDTATPLTEDDIDRIQGASYVTGQESGQTRILNAVDEKAKELLGQGIEVLNGNIFIPDAHKVKVLSRLLEFIEAEQNRVLKEKATRLAAARKERP